MKSWLKGGLIGSVVGLISFIFLGIAYASVIPKINSLHPAPLYFWWVLIALLFFNPVVGFIIGSIYAKIKDRVKNY